MASCKKPAAEIVETTTKAATTNGINGTAGMMCRCAVVADTTTTATTITSGIPKLSAHHQHRHQHRHQRQRMLVAPRRMPTSMVAGRLSVLLAVVVAAAVAFQIADALELDHCTHPLGMESGNISDKQITASSAHDIGNVGPQHARLKVDNNGGAWCPKHMISQNLKEYLQIDLLSVHVITAVRTQGRFGKGQGQEYTEAYILEYWRPGFAKWERWKSIVGKEVLTGNINTYSEVENILQPLVFASQVRIYPYSQYDRTICLRAELFGCKWEDNLISYSIPKAVQRGLDIDLADEVYDGHEDGDRLVGGLGQLVDGQRGTDNYRSDIHGFGKGYEWVGWRNDSLGGPGQPVEIVFEFDTTRNFSAIVIHTNNMFTKDVQVFGHAKIFFSLGGKHFGGEPVSYSYMPDLVMEHARDVTIKLHYRVGRFVQLNLYFALRWIMLSEISFVSTPAQGNFSSVEAMTTAPLNLANPSQQRNDVQKMAKKKPEKKIVPQIISPKPIDHQEPEQQLVGVLVVVATAIVLLLVAVILFVTACRKKSGNSFEHGVFSEEAVRIAHNKRVSDEDSESLGKSTLYHEPFSVNMYTTSGAVANENGLLQSHRHLGGGSHHLQQHNPTYAQPLHSAQHPANISHQQQQKQQQKLLHQQQQQQQQSAGLLHQPQHITPDYTDVPDIMCQEYASTNMQEIINKLPDNYLTSKYLSATAAANNHQTSTINSTTSNNTSASSANKTTPNVPTTTTTTTTNSNTITSNHINKSNNHHSTLPSHNHLHHLHHPHNNNQQQLQSAATLQQQLQSANNPMQSTTLGHDTKKQQQQLATVAAAAATIYHTSPQNFYFDVDAAADAPHIPHVPTGVTPLAGGGGGLKEFSRHSLVIVEKLGVGQYGEFHLCETKEPNQRLVAVATLRPGASAAAKSEFVRTAERLGRLRHVNVAALAGACLLDEPICFVVNFNNFRGDLAKYLQEHQPLPALMMAADVPIGPMHGLSYGSQIYIATQIASGMKYLEKHNYVHMDLAARTCIVGAQLDVKICCFGSVINQTTYPADYCYIDEAHHSLPIPIRWMAWESVLLGKFSSKSDVWSFAITLWEILTYARETPFAHMSNEMVIDNVSSMYLADRNYVLPSLPHDCPKEIYDLMCECWQRDDANRPNFGDIHLFLQRKNLGYKPSFINNCP